MRLAANTTLLAGLWWLFVQGRPDAWLVGVPAVVFAAFVSIRLGSPVWPGINLRALPAFVALFLHESLRGGLDVARRTLGPKLDITPGFYSYRLQTTHPAARVLLVNCIGLLPGTLAADLDSDRAELHLLDTSQNAEPQLRRLEQAIGRLFGLTTEISDD
ncbi:MAG: Na+/H+ antiporter subunit E [Pseudomonadota bacterium]